MMEMIDKITCYMNIAKEMAKMSPDAETQVGAVMLSSEGRIIALSFNGFLRGADDTKLPNTRPDKYQYMQHAERNMIYNCAYEGIATKDTIVICTLSPCLDCLRAMYQSGIKTVIFEKLYSSFPDTDFYTKLSDVKIKVSTKNGYTLLEMEKTK